MAKKIELKLELVKIIKEIRYPCNLHDTKSLNRKIQTLILLIIDIETKKNIDIELVGLFFRYAHILSP